MPKVSSAPAAAPSVAEFAPPRVEVGQVVLWRFGPGSSPSPAIVLKVAARTLSLSLHIDGVRDHVFKNGVRHVSDPFLKTSPAHDMGVWDLTPRDRAINAVLDSALPAEE